MTLGVEMTKTAWSIAPPRTFHFGRITLRNIFLLIRCIEDPSLVKLGL